MTETKPLLVEVTGNTELKLGSGRSINSRITIGYRKFDGKNCLFSSFIFPEDEGIKIGDLILVFTRKNIDYIPKVLQDVSFKKFSINYTSGSINDADGLVIKFDCNIKINDKIFPASITINYNEKAEGGVLFSFSGILTIDKLQFSLNFIKKGKKSWYMFANYLNDGKTKIDYKNIISKFLGDEAIKKIPELSLELDECTAFIFYEKSHDNPKLLFGMGAGLDMDLTNLPMAGPILSESKAFAFEEALAIYNKGFVQKDFNDDVLKRLKNSKLSELLSKIEITIGAQISMKLRVNDTVIYQTLNTNISQKNSEEDTVQQQLGEITKQSILKPLDTAALSNAKWKKINKKIGPVSIQQLGFVFHNGRVIMLLDAGLEMAGMGIQLLGFGLSFQLKWPPSNVQFHLRGIGLSYQAPPIDISGMFLHSTENGTDIFNGGAVIKLKRFTISAIGSYAKAGDQTSLFIYGVHSGPIGGPAFFFVTGVAAGFGYNRKVNIPSLDEIHNYPLVALAMNPKNDKGLPKILNSLDTPMKNGKKPVEISAGDYWMAVGIKFTSFKIIESFVLLTVNFGTKMEFALIGLSKLRWPDASKGKPIAYVELQIRAQFGPDSDVIAVESVITPNSYILSKDCTLSGGFAFYTWIKGKNEGDFVITLGGYHPRFRKPDHYPTVPRLALSWRINSELQIKGQMYYALTSSSVMAGGRWEILYKTSIVKVTITIWADMLINWAPFYYEISIGITLRIEARIKILGIPIYFNFEMGARLNIWGPDFSGKAYIDWSIFSFTIRFGAIQKPTPKKLEWKEFAKSFIPQKNTGGELDPINISINNGLIATKGNDKTPIINPLQLSITIDSFIPVTRLIFNKDDDNNDYEIDSKTSLITGNQKSFYENRNKGIGIRPCDYKIGAVDFIMEVSVKKMGEHVHNMSITCIAKQLPEALWGDGKSNLNNANPGAPKMISDVLTGLLMQPPPLPKVAEQKPYDFSRLFDEKSKSLCWKFKLAKGANAYDANKVFEYYHLNEDGTREHKKGILTETYNNSSVTEKRKKILEELDDFGISIPEKEEKMIENIMLNGKTYFKGTPIICGIGQIPKYTLNVKNG
ncbi:hypothetical protein ATE84_2615 [Aquimarina sp. MAR_2010_214]|uniref:DUF6603 domain-containing protein n=1 Tax=Aquimarina sp. MAR_2010_214 TaxID=1250026 RepID=UPI000C705E2B|nr:DUF6603 domain-containing protein [Aquimarina sp. MAR_2010_214]PKV50556.1 hypothetical protein ATE84_2615 [Aquimarina sp. MAR_2010_214]